MFCFRATCLSIYEELTRIPHSTFRKPNWLSDNSRSLNEDETRIVVLSTFNAILDGLAKQNADAPPPCSGSWGAVRGLNSGFVGSVFGLDHSGRGEQLAAACAAYGVNHFAAPPTRCLGISAWPQRAGIDKVVEPPRIRIDTSVFKRLSPEEIVKDIRLLSTDTPAQLKMKRRNFARENHPTAYPQNGEKQQQPA
ncbi:MAG: hypothetical protein H6887_08170 [Hoeflea sp.]|nr:hypothetical protein [Hoeflea sp.]